MSDYILEKQEEVTKSILESEPEDMLEKAGFENPLKSAFFAEHKCIGCGGFAIRTNNTLCQACWNDAECFEDNE